MYKEERVSVPSPSIRTGISSRGFIARAPSLRKAAIAPSQDPVTFDRSQITSFSRASRPLGLTRAGVASSWKHCRVRPEGLQGLFQVPRLGHWQVHPEYATFSLI